MAEENTAADMDYENLPDDIIEQILSLLPVKTLIRFRSVCKSWYSLIADSSFIKLHLANHSSCGDNHCILATSRTYHYNSTYSNSIYSSLSFETCHDMQHSTLDLPFMPVSDCESGYCNIEGSCNGLICLYDSHEFGYNLYIWNPFIRLLKPIPQTCDDIGFKTSYFCGIGFYEPTNDYIVVKLTRYWHITNTQFQVYSLNADSWRTVNRSNKLLPVRVRFGSYSVSLNGYIYWMGMDNDILSFSTSSDDLFEQTMHPSYKEHGRNYVPLQVQVVKESLYLLIAPYGDERDVCDIWVMKEHGVFESWTMLYRVVIKDGIMKHCGVLRHINCFYGLTANGKLLLSLKEDESVNEDLFVYDYKKIKLVDLQRKELQNLSSVISLNESLVLLDCLKTKLEF